MKILVVDDSMVYRKTIVNYLEAEMPDVEYITAQDGQEGFELYQEEDPDYIFLDLLMPELNGEEVLAKIREEDQETGVIILTADVQKMVKEDVEKLSILEFINKPFSPEKAEEIEKRLGVIIMLNELQKDALQEYLNISIGKAANLLSEMTDQRVKLNIPNIELVSGHKVEEDKETLPDFLKGHVVSSSLSFGDDRFGKASLVFPVEDTKLLIDLFIGDEDFSSEEVGERELTDTDFDAMREIANIILNALMGGLGNLLSVKFEYNLPQVELIYFTDEDNSIDLSNNKYLLIIQSVFDLQDVSITGSVVIILSMDSISFLRTKIDNQLEEFLG